MAVRHSGGGPADRTLALLWRNHRPATEAKALAAAARRST